MAFLRHQVHVSNNVVQNIRHNILDSMIHVVLGSNDKFSNLSCVNDILQILVNVMLVEWRMEKWRIAALHV